MQTSWKLLVVAIIAMASVGLTGCDEEKQPAAGAATVTEKKVDPAPAAANPATAKPKDHPAH